MTPRKATMALTHRKDYLLKRVANLDEGSSPWHFARQEIEALNLALALLSLEMERRALQMAEGERVVPSVRPTKLTQTWHAKRADNSTGEIT